MPPAEETSVTLGEVSRGLSRVEAEMRDGFTAVKNEIKSLSFVPAAVYSADKVAWADRFERLSIDFEDERAARRDIEATAAQRAWQSRTSMILALIGMPISVMGAVVAAFIIAALR